MFDTISDLHFDFWHPDSVEEGIRSLLPANPSATLVLAGDYSHNNQLTLHVLKLLRKQYENIVLVFGNHDYYVFHHQYNSSLDRIAEMRRLAGNIEGVHVLNGNTIQIDGVTYGGADMWYDFEYGKQLFHQSTEQMNAIWKTQMADSKYLVGIDPLRFFQKERKKVEQVIDKSDVIVSHVGPDWSRVPFEYQNPLTGCFYFDGADLLERCNNKIWIYGHTHQRTEFMKSGCYLLNPAFGYLGPETDSKKIITIG